MEVTYRSDYIDLNIKIESGATWSRDMVSLNLVWTSTLRKQKIYISDTCMWTSQAQSRSRYVIRLNKSKIADYTQIIIMWHFELLYIYLYTLYTFMATFDDTVTRAYKFWSNHFCVNVCPGTGQARRQDNSIWGEFQLLFVL